MFPVSDVMSRDVLTFGVDTPVAAVAEQLAARHITGAPVVNTDGYVLGIVSESDIFLKQGRTAFDIMSTHVVSVSESMGIDEAARLLVDQKIRRLPVLREGRLVGLISRSDVLDFFVHRVWTCGECGHGEHGLQAPSRCPVCSGTRFALDWANPKT